MKLEPLKTEKLPAPLPLLKLIGPSFILLGLGLGSGEVILWPYLTANYGMGIMWAAVLGITFQFLMNMEIERYALTKGESVFAGLTRKVSWLPWWFLLSTFIPWVWPGIAATSARIIGTIFGIPQTNYITIGLLVLMGLILSLGPTLYKTVERFQKTLITIGVPSIFILSIYLARSEHFADALAGIIGIGKGYYFLPEGISVASFLAAFAYAGAGGNLNLAQSFYVKEKGYAMGKYGGKITSLLTGKKDEVHVTGAQFEINKENMSLFQKWWKNVNIEHFFVFYLTGAVTIVMLGLLSYTTTFGKAGTQGIGFLLLEAQEIGRLIFPAAGTFFLIITGLTLFGTQLTVFDATSRIMGENAVLALYGKLRSIHIRPAYYFILWAQILAGIIIITLGFTEPLALLILAAVLNAVAMFVHAALTLWLNLTSLEMPLRPALWRVIILSAAILFYGGFSAYVIYDNILKLLK